MGKVLKKWFPSEAHPGASVVDAMWESVDEESCVKQKRTIPVTVFFMMHEDACMLSRGLDNVFLDMTFEQICHSALFRYHPCPCGFRTLE